MAEAKKRARQRRFLIAVVVLVLLGGTAGAIAGFRSPHGPNSVLPSAFGGSNSAAPTGDTRLAIDPQVGLSFGYPVGWQPRDCGYSTGFGTMGVINLWAAAGRPRCLLGGVALRRLSTNGVAVLWQQEPLFKLAANARLGGQPSRVEVWNAHRAQFTGCAAAGGQRVIQAEINEPATANYGFEMVACLRGPKLSQSQAEVGQMLTSLRFYPRPGQ